MYAESRIIRALLQLFQPNHHPLINRGKLCHGIITSFLCCASLRSWPSS